MPVCAGIITYLLFFMRAFSLYVCCTLMACTAMAQRNYVPGTIVGRNNDSLKGFIDFHDWYIVPKTITFKNSLSDAKEEQFSPDDINGFYIAEPEKEYVSRRVEIDITNQDMSALTESDKRTIQDTTVFLRKITGGTYNLYEYVDKNSRQHFIYDGGNRQATELKRLQAYLQRGSNSGIFTEDRYKDQLEELFADDKAAVRKARMVKYDERALTKLFINYNTLKNPATVSKPITDPKKQIRYPATFGVMGGVSSNKLNVKSNSVLYNGEYTSYTGPVGGVWVDIPFGRAVPNISAELELLYKRTKTEATTLNGNAYRYDFGYLQFNTLVRYTYPTKTAIRPYANIGIGNGFIVKTAKNEFHYATRPGEWTKGEEPRKYEQSFVGGIGVKIYRFGVEARYNTSNGFSPYSGTKTAVNSLQLLASVSF